MAREPLVYWDTNIFLALLMDEDRPGDDMEGVYEWAEKIDKGDARLITSVVTRIEVLESKLTPEVRERFRAVLRRSNVQEVEVGPRIADLAHDLRDHYQALRDVAGGPGLCSMDAIHLATGIIYEVDEVHTFDEKDKNNCLGLIPLSGSVAGYDLTICKPKATQFQLRFDTSDQADGEPEDDL